MSATAAPPISEPSAPPAGARPSSDERLARQVSRGSERAFTQLYTRHHQALYRYCRSILRDEEDAGDVLQSAMTRAFVALRSGERDLAVRPWLFRIAHNEAISLIRKRRHEPAPLVERPDPIDLDRAIEQRERVATLLSDLRTLPERQRAALVMRELSGLSIEEIAAALSISSGAAKQVIFEARTSLHELAEGRAMDCEPVRHLLSERDGRVLRGRKIRAHLRSCARCRDFRAAIATRPAELRALAPPIPVAAAGSVLSGVLAAAGGGHTAGGVAATASGAGAGAGAGGLSGGALGAHGASLAIKALAGVAVVGAAAGTARLTVLAPVHHRHPHAHIGSLSHRPAGAHTPAPAPPGVATSAHTPGGPARGPQRGVRERPHRATGRGAARPATRAPRAPASRSSTAGGPAPRATAAPGLPPQSPPRANASPRAQSIATPSTAGQQGPHGHTGARSGPHRADHAPSSHKLEHPHKLEHGHGQKHAHGSENGRHLGRGHRTRPPSATPSQPSGAPPAAPQTQGEGKGQGKGEGETKGKAKGKATVETKGKGKGKGAASSAPEATGAQGTGTSAERPPEGTAHTHASPGTSKTHP